MPHVIFDFLAHSSFTNEIVRAELAFDQLPLRELDISVFEKSVDKAIIMAPTFLGFSPRHDLFQSLMAVKIHLH